MNQTSRLFVLTAVSAIVLATAALADNPATDDDKREKKNVAVFINKEDDDSDAKIKLKINGESWKFQLPALSDGEERIIATEDGRTVKAKRAGKNVSIEAGGETINLPADGHGMHVRFHGVPPVPPVPPVPGVATVPPMPPEELKALRESIVISGIELSEAEQKKVRDAIKKAGIDKPVKFFSGGHRVMMRQDGPMVWQEGGPGKTVRTIIMSKDGNDGEDVEIESDIEIIRGVDKQTDKSAKDADGTR